MSQTNILYNILKDGQPHRSDELVKLVYGNQHLGLARLGARVWDIKKKYGVEIYGWADKEIRTLYWYQLKTKTGYWEAKKESGEWWKEKRYKKKPLQVAGREKPLF